MRLSKQQARLLGDARKKTIHKVFIAASCGQVHYETIVAIAQAVASAFRKHLQEILGVADLVKYAIKRLRSDKKTIIGMPTS